MDSYFDSTENTAVDVSAYQGSNNLKVKFTDIFIKGSHMSKSSGMKISNIFLLRLKGLKVISYKGLPIQVINSEITMCDVLIQENEGRIMGAILLWKSKVTFLGRTVFARNYGYDCPGVLYARSSTLIFPWLQFVFPLYIWFLVITIIVVSHYYTLAARLSGRNAVPVLATLFLLSYAKLLRIIITVFQSTELEYPDNMVRKVWLYDGNVDYLKGKHILLFIAALLLLLISLPYTAILIFIQYLQHALVQLQSAVLGEEIEATL